MIKKITEDLFLYQGNVKTKAELQVIIVEYQERIAANQEQMDSIELIEIIPEIRENPQYLEAMELYNRKQADDIELYKSVIEIDTSFCVCIKGAL